MGQLVDFGYYWASMYELKPGDIDSDQIERAKTKACEISDILKLYTNFYVIDMAQTEDGEWILIDLNDGQMSGLSAIPAERFYSNLSKIINKE